jgi:hypothetical protein
MALASNLKAIQFIAPKAPRRNYSMNISVCCLPHPKSSLREYETEREALLSMDVKASSPKKEIDFSDPNWKERFQEDWEKRFRLPHITDILDVKPRHSTFSLKKSR